MRETKDILTAWKNTRILKRMGTEYPSKSAGIQGAPRDFDYRQYLTEDEAQIVDNAVLALRKDDYNLWVILTSVYLREFNCNKLAIILGLSKNDTYKMLDKAENFIRGYVYISFNKNST